MNVTATYKGSSVTIVDVTKNGSAIYVTYVDGSDVLLVDTTMVPPTSASATVQIATSATVN